VAEGVRIYSQQSWKMVIGTEGKHMVEKYITETVSKELLVPYTLFSHQQLVAELCSLILCLLSPSVLCDKLLMVSLFVHINIGGAISGESGINNNFEW